MVTSPLLGAGYGLGDEGVMCWLDAVAGPCPPGLDLKWIEPPPTELHTDVPFQASYRIDLGSAVPRPTDDGYKIAHANLHACKVSVGFCNPFLQPQMQDGHQLVAHEKAQSGDELKYRSQLSLDEGPWTIIAHVYFFVNEGSRLDAAIGTKRFVIDSPENGSDGVHCWRNSKPEECPPGMAVVWVDAPPQNLNEGTLLSGTFQLSPGPLTIVPDSDDLDDLGPVKARLIGCRLPQPRNISCNPLHWDEQNDAVTSTNFTRGVSLKHTARFSLPAGNWSIIAHFRFSDSDQNTWDTSLNIIRTVAPGVEPPRAGMYVSESQESSRILQEPPLQTSPQTSNTPGSESKNSNGGDVSSDGPNISAAAAGQEPEIDANGEEMENREEIGEESKPQEQDAASSKSFEENPENLENPNIMDENPEMDEIERALERGDYVPASAQAPGLKLNNGIGKEPGSLETELLKGADGLGNQETPITVEGLSGVRKSEGDLHSKNLTLARHQENVAIALGRDKSSQEGNHVGVALGTAALLLVVTLFAWIGYAVLKRRGRKQQTRVLSKEHVKAMTVAPAIPRDPHMFKPTAITTTSNVLPSNTTPVSSCAASESSSPISTSTPYTSPPKALDRPPSRGSLQGDSGTGTSLRSPLSSHSVPDLGRVNRRQLTPFSSVDLSHISMPITAQKRAEWRPQTRSTSPVYSGNSNSGNSTPKGSRIRSRHELMKSRSASVKVLVSGDHGPQEGPGGGQNLAKTKSVEQFP